jgi:protein SCO1/2
MRTIPGLLIALILGMSVTAAVSSCSQAGELSASASAKLMEDLMWGRGSVGGPFELIDHLGVRRTDADFRGKFLLVYFGYTYCPDVCPTDLAQIAAAIDRLGADGDKIQPLFISVDPERDTPAVLKTYVSAFHNRLVGLTGTPEQVEAAAKAYKAYYAKYAPEGSSEYFAGHTGFIYLMDISDASRPAPQRNA